MKTTLAVMARHWTPGQAKTRLAEAIGSELASEFHRLSLQTSLARFAGTADRRLLVYTPASARAEFARLAGTDWELVDQGSGDLGRRLAQLAERELVGEPAPAEPDPAEHSERSPQRAMTGGRPSVRANARLVVLGADSPTVPRDWILRAFALLRGADLVLGPAEDGGYYLIGITQAHQHLFAGIDWGSSAVYQQTLAAADSLGLKVSTLPVWYDVDRLDDLQRLYGELCQLNSHELARQSHTALSTFLASLNARSVL